VNPPTEPIPHNSLIPLREEAYHGIAGDIIKRIEPHSEADPVALLIQFLATFGNIIGNKPHFKVEDDVHSLKIYPVLVGNTSKGRKGTSWSRIRKVYEQIDPNWPKNHILAGLSSGEGLIFALQEHPDKDKACKPILIIETEFAATLKVMKREGNTLSTVIRESWDGVDLGTLTKNNPLRASNHHLTIIGHITKEELLKHLTETEMANGFGNRFLWLYVQRSKLLPEGGNLNLDEFIPLINKLKELLNFSSTVSEIKKDEESRRIWTECYSRLSQEKTGLAGYLTARAEAYVIRIASLFAILDKSSLIRPEHLKAALAIWDYSEASVFYIFGDRIGDTLADCLYHYLKSIFPNSVTRTQINRHFQGHKESKDISRALQLLRSQDKADCISRSTDGRNEEQWYLIAKKAE